MKRYLLLAIGLAMLPVAVRADDGITPEIIDAVKKATVFIRVEGEGWSGSGSGFVVASDDKGAFVATNNHVASPTPPSGARTSGKPAAISAVFDSGTKTERTYTATIVGTDAERDLAVLRIEGVKDVPKAIATTDLPKPFETMQVYTFGFPFGKALSTNKGFPAVTVGKASISSLRNGNDGELSVVQIDGNLNPGNSGGPVVDAKGRLVGIAVATIRDGQGIGLTVPAAELAKLMEGRLGRVRVAAKKKPDGSTAVRIEVDLLDPMQCLRSATAHYVIVEPKAKRPEVEALDKHAGSKKLELKIEKGVGAAELTLAAVEGEVLVQVFAEPAGKPAVASRVRAYPLASALKPGEKVGPPPAGWKEYSPGDKSFTVWVPEKPAKQSDQERILVARAQRIRMTTMTGKSTSGLIYEAQSILMPLSYMRAPRKELYEMFRNSIAGDGGKVTETKDAEMGDLSGNEYTIESGSTVTRARIFAVGSRVYIVLVTGTADEVEGAEAETILTSYRIPAPLVPKQPGDIAAPGAVKEGTIVGGGNAPTFKDLAPEKGMLIGLELGLGKFGNEDVIKAVRPLYRVGDKDQLGSQHGERMERTVTIKAKAGYAVGAMTYKFGLNFDGCSLTFMKVVDGKLDAKDSYESDWVGYVGTKNANKMSGDGVPAIGIVGRGSDKEVNGLGLVFANGEGSKSTPANAVPIKGKEPTILGGAFDPEFKDAAPEGGILIGFEIGLGKFFDRDMIRAARPIYRIGEAESFGEQRGTQVKNLVVLKAKPGYAVGAISVKHGLGFDGMSITYMKVVDGKLDPKDNYESDFVGSDEAKPLTKLGGDGRPAIGIVGKKNDKDMTGMGLLFKGQESYEPKRR